MDIIFVVYEWCFAVLAVVLYRKMKNIGSFLLAIGLVIAAVLTAIEYAAGKFGVESVLFSKILLMSMLVTLLLSVIGFFVIVINLEKYVGKR